VGVSHIEFVGPALLEHNIKFAKIIFWIAAIWGILILTPLYFIFDTIGGLAQPVVSSRGCPALVSPFFGETGRGF